MHVSFGLKFFGSFVSPWTIILTPVSSGLDLLRKLKSSLSPFSDDAGELFVGFFGRKESRNIKSITRLGLGTRRLQGRSMGYIMLTVVVLTAPGWVKKT